MYLTARQRYIDILVNTWRPWWLLLALSCRYSTAGLQPTGPSTINTGKHLHWNLLHCFALHLTKAFPKVLPDVQTCRLHLNSSASKQWNGFFKMTYLLFTDVNPSNTTVRKRYKAGWWEESNKLQHMLNLYKGKHCSPFPAWDCFRSSRRALSQLNSPPVVAHHSKAVL